MGEGPVSQNSKRLPGELSAKAEAARMIRVDQAGEFGATRIYEGQLAVLGGREAGDEIGHMAEQERAHLAKFNALMNERRVRPTVLSPLWYVAGYALGAATALMGEKAAMACTVAIEEVIDEHYTAQSARLSDATGDGDGDRDPELKDLIEECRADEVAHKETALEKGARDVPGYSLLTGAIKTSSRVAIWLSQRV